MRGGLVVLREKTRKGSFRANRFARSLAVDVQNSTKQEPSATGNCGSQSCKVAAPKLDSQELLGFEEISTNDYIKGRQAS